MIKTRENYQKRDFDKKKITGVCNGATHKGAKPMFVVFTTNIWLNDYFSQNVTNTLFVKIFLLYRKIK